MLSYLPENSFGELTFHLFPLSLGTGNAGPFQLCFSKMIAVAFEQRRLQMRNCPRVAPGIEMGGAEIVWGQGPKSGQG